MLLYLLLLYQQVIDAITSVFVRLGALIVLVDASAGDGGEVCVPEEIRRLAIRSLWSSRVN